MPTAVLFYILCIHTYTFIHIHILAARASERDRKRRGVLQAHESKMSLVQFNMESKDIRIKIFNNHYTLKGDDIELVEKSAQYVDTLMNKIQNDIPNQSDITVAIVSALNIAENYYREKNSSFVLDQNYKSLLNGLNSQIKDINEYIEGNT